MLKKTVVLACVAVLAMACTAGAATVEAWAASSSGASDHTAYFVLDYDGGPNTYLFGYRWNDGEMVTRPDDGSAAYDTYTGLFGTQASAATSEGMIYALMNVAGMTVAHSWHGTYGLFLENFEYDGNAFDVTSFNNPWSSVMTSFWSGNLAWDSGWASGPAQAPGTWEQMPMGVVGRELADGFWDGWMQGQFNVITWETVAPDPSISPVPEPVTMSLMLIGGAGLLARRRRTVS